MAINKRTYILPKGTEPTAQVIADLLGSTKRAQEVRKYDVLERYYNAETIAQDPEYETKLVSVTAYARYIVGLNCGYLLGNPVAYSVSEGIDIAKLQEAYDNQKIQNIDIKLENDASKFGHGFERIYVNEDGECRSAAIDPRSIILVRDNTVEHRKMFALIYVECVNEKGEVIEGEYDLTIITRDKVMERRLKGGVLVGDESGDLDHVFGDVPVVEYINDDDLIGDFEAVIPLIDSYNILQTARIKDRLKTANALLLVSGGNLDEKQIDAIMEGRIADLPEGAKAEYITKSTNEQESETLRISIADDIHKISMTPDVSDKNFAGSASGVSLQYKLFTFEKHAKDKERCFEAALMERFALYNAYLNRTANMEIIPTAKVDAVFQRALPQNDVEMANMINSLAGIVDKKTLISQLSFVNDAEEVVAAAAREEEESLKLGNYGTFNPDMAKDTEDDKEASETDE